MRERIKQSKAKAMRREMAEKIARHNAIIDGLPSEHEVNDYIFEI